MGKIRVKVFDETEQLERDKKLAARREQKKVEKTAAKKPANTESTEKGNEAQNLKTTEPKTYKLITDDQTPRTENRELRTESKYAAKKGLNKKTKSKKYLVASSLVDKKKIYKLKDAVELLKKIKTAKFDETVELHINTREKGVAGQLSLPHGTGKTRRIKIADDELIANIERGVIDFDVLVAAPAAMPKLAKVARVLGPRGLMPNPKNGTVTDKVQEAVEKLNGGQVNYKTEQDAPVIHMSIGKSSFDDKKIEENVTSVINSIGANKIENITLKLTMSPGIRMQL